MQQYIYKNRGRITIIFYVVLLLLLAFPFLVLRHALNENDRTINAYSIFWLIKPWEAVHYWILVIIIAVIVGLINNLLKPHTSSGFLFGLAGLVSLIFIQLSMNNGAAQHTDKQPVFETVTAVYWLALSCFLFIIAVSYLGDKDQPKNHNGKNPASPAIHINIITKGSDEKK